MAQLTLGAILQLANELKDDGMSTKEIAALPIYIGDDDELNGIHCAWFGQVVDADNENDESFVELINECRGKEEFEGKAILIS